MFTTPPKGQAFEPLFQDATRKYGLPPGLISRQAMQESGYNPNAVNVVSGAKGLMQFVMVWHPEVSNPFDPVEAVDKAGAFLSRLHREFGSWQKALAAYNWGEGYLSGDIHKYGDDWLAHVPTETYNYVTRIARDTGVV